MTVPSLRPALLAIVLATAATGAARADCESDMLQLEDAMKAPGQSPAVQAAYKDAAAKAATAMRKDDDDTCHKAIAEALGKAGKSLK